MTRGYHKSIKASFIERLLDLLCCMEQNVGLQKDDMCNKCCGNVYVALNLWSHKDEPNSE